MNRIRAYTWYAGHIDSLWIVYVIPVALSWYFVFQPIDRQELTWVVIALMAAIYYWFKRLVRRGFHDAIVRSSREFAQSPSVTVTTNEMLLDSFDLQILKTVNEARDEKGDYIKVIPELSDLMLPNELIQRLGKLRALNMIRPQTSRLALTPAGLEWATSPAPLGRATIPPKFASKLAEARLRIEGGDYGGATDSVNTLFEELLRAALSEKFGNFLESKWNELLSQGHIRQPFERANLGALLGASKRLGVITDASVVDNLLSAFLKIRVPAKHATAEKTEPQRDALTAIELAQILFRQWFS